MNAARDQLFAGATFAQNQDGILMLADLFHNLVDALHLHGNADEPAEARPGAQLLAQQCVFLLELHGACDTFEPGTQFFDAEGFGDVVDSAEAGNLHGRFNGSVLRQHHDVDLRV
jgi:hypothetical protein